MELQSPRKAILRSRAWQSGARPLTKPLLPDFVRGPQDSKRAVMTRTGQKTAFAFAGGGSLGAIQVGMLRVLVSEGVQPDFVVGASVGAMNAAYFAGAPNAEGVERLAEIWSGFGAKRSFRSPSKAHSVCSAILRVSSIPAACGI
jgi:predicted acylesterase/phospholipase RssA